jgi:hypothetical protein
MNLQLGQKVYHNKVYWGREEMEVVGIKKDSVLLSGDWSGGTHNVIQEGWMPIKGVLKNKSKANLLDIIMENINKQKSI